MRLERVASFGTGPALVLALLQGCTSGAPWEARRVPSINFDRARTTASMQRRADLPARRRAVLWINHDTARRDLQRMAPAFYE